MNIVLFIIFLMISLSTVGIIAAVYSGKERYSEGMVLGVHIPKSETDNLEVQALGNKYKRDLKRFSLWNLLVSACVCFLCFWNFIYFIIVWMVWLFIYISAWMYFINSSHRRMYDIKMKNNWIMEGGTHIVHIDTVVSSMARKLPISHWWSFLFVICIGVLLLIPQVREYFGDNPVQWIMPGTVLLTAVFFWVFHIWFTHRRTIVYSNDSSVNMAMNRAEKRTWSVIMLSANLMNLLGWGYLTIKIAGKHWLYDIDFWIYIVLQMIPLFVILFGIIYIQKRRKQLLSMDLNAITADDDEYWKTGWYNNPNDTHLWVQDRMCSTNYTMNMAKPAAKIIAAATAVLLTVVIAGAFYLTLSLENAKITLLMNGNQITIDAAMYDSHFDKSEIKSIEVLKKLPEDDFARTNGGATEKYLIGHFKGKEIGECMMYIYRGYTPILQVKLKDKTIYINSKNENEVLSWYQKLKQ